MADYGANFESFYQGEYSSLSPTYGPFSANTMGYRMSAAQLGFPGSAQTANQLGEAVNALKQGVKAFEVSLVVPETEQSIPQQHFAEMRALMKLSGVKPSVHGPLVDAAGFGEKGWGGDYSREDNERRMFDAIEKAHELDPNGNVPIVFHSTNGIPGAEYLPGDEKKGEERFRADKKFAIDQETYKMVDLKREFKFRPYLPGSLKKGGEEDTPEDQLRAVNVAEWENKLTDLATFMKHTDEVIGASAFELEKSGYRNAAIVGSGNKVDKIVDLSTGKELPNFVKGNDEDSALLRQGYQRLRESDIFLENVQLNFNSAFHKAYKYGSDDQRKELESFAEKYAKEMGSLIRQDDEGAKAHEVFAPLKKREILGQAINNLQAITKKHGPPQIFKEVEGFAMEKAAETFGNLAIKSYDEYGSSAPVIAIENMFQGMAFSRADDLKELVSKSRERFKDYLIEEKGLDEKEAKKMAEKHLGVTWDVGHLNIIKKKGFTDKDIVEETKKIAPMVKHVHLTDNFGYSDSHLAPGMGNVPFKKILEELEKTGRLKEMRKIVEAPNFVQHFKKSPHPWTLSAFGSPIYGAKMTPYWNQASDTIGSYFGGYGTINPEQHHTMYGAGFTTMPVELGGQMPSANRSRFGGAPLA
jgi:sugar phosphate isomerase/epimerase